MTVDADKDREIKPKNIYKNFIQKVYHQKDKKKGPKMILFMEKKYYLQS